MKYCISKMGTALLLIIKKQVPKRKIRIFGKAWERNDTHMTWMGTDLFYRQKIILLVPITINKVAKTSNVCLSIVRSLFYSLYSPHRFHLALLARLSRALHLSHG